MPEAGLLLSFPCRLKQQHPSPAEEQQQQQHIEAAVSAMMGRILLVKPSAGEELIRGKQTLAPRAFILIVNSAGIFFKKSF